MSDLQVFPIAVFGGISESRAEPQPTDYESLVNTAIYRGRLGMRAPISAIASLQVPRSGTGSGVKQTSGAVKYGYTDFSEFTDASPSIPTGMVVELTHGSPAYSIGSVGAEGSYFEVDPDDTGAITVAITSLANAITTTESFEILSRIYVSTPRVGGNRRYGGGAARLDNNGGACDAIGASLIVQDDDPADFEAEVISLNDKVSGGGGTQTLISGANGDISQAEQTNVWGWHRFRLDYEGTSAGTSDIYVKFWYGDMDDEPAGWDSTATEVANSSLPTDGQGVGLSFPAFLDTTAVTGIQRVAFMSYTTDWATVPTPDNLMYVDDILAITEHEGEIWTVSYSGTSDTVYLHSMDVAGTLVTYRGAVWTGVTTRPNAVRLLSFNGGDADTLEPRLYIADYTQIQDTVYWDGTQIVTVTWDLDANDTAEDIQFSNIAAYKFHIWGSGFFEGTTKRGEMVRFSQPGAIPGTDIAGGTPAIKEWHTADHRSLGRRGYPITNMTTAGDRLIVFQVRSAHAIYGSGATTWAKQELSSTIGCVGPHAATSAEDKMCYFWGDDGPYRTDGTQIQYIGDPIRQIITSVEATGLYVVAQYSPTDGIVHFLLGEEVNGVYTYQYDLMFHHKLEAWTTARYADTSGDIEIGCMTAASEGFPEGPAADPSSLTATDVSATEIDLDWVTGDASINAKTLIHRAIGASITPSDANLIATIDGGLIEYSDTGLAAQTQYTYAVRHKKYGQFSNAITVTQYAKIATPTISVLSAETGIAYTITKTTGIATDVQIQRRETWATSWETALEVATNDSNAVVTGTDTAVTLGDRYYYRVYLEDNAGAVPNSDYHRLYETTLAGVPAGLPDAPDLTATTQIGDEAVIAFDDLSENEDEWILYYNTVDVDGSYTELARKPTVDKLGNGYEEFRINVTLFPGEDTYFFKVAASNLAGEVRSNSDSLAVVIPI